MRFVATAPIAPVAPGINLFGELRKLVEDKKLLKKRPWQHVRMNLFVLALLGLSIAILVMAQWTLVVLLDAVFMGFVFGQIAFIAHDTGHRQVFRQLWSNQWTGLFHGNLLLGMSFGWWVDKHDRHHSNPNQVDFDPDIDIFVLAFDEEQALRKRGVSRFIVKYQKYFFFPLLMFQAFSLRGGSIGYLTAHKSKQRLAEIALMTAHFALFFGIIFAELPLWQALGFIGVQQAVFGLYLASVFAPNHKGMPLLEADTQMDFLRRQILTARNVRAHPLTDFWYGGLNYQIEHHLFPNMPRSNLREAQKIVRDFCGKHGIAYHETSMLQSWKEILWHLHEVSRVLRRLKAAPASQA